MKFKDLPQFHFYIGNTLEEELDVVVTNKGLAIDDEIVVPFDGDGEADINDVDDLEELIGDTIDDCDRLTDDDKEELGVVFYSDAVISVNAWWNEKVSH